MATVDGSNFTPLSSLDKKQKKSGFSPPNKVIIGLIGVLLIAIGLVAALIILQKPVRKAVPAVTGGTTRVCNIILGPPTDEVINDHYYSLRIPVHNNRNSSATVQILVREYFCGFNDQPTCPVNGEVGGGTKAFPRFDLTIPQDQTQYVDVKVNNTLGTACGQYQVDAYINSVNGDVTCTTRPEGNPNGGPVTGGYKAPIACGVTPSPTPPPSATNTPTPTPTVPPPGGPSNTPTPTPTVPPPGGPSNTPTPTRTPTPPPGATNTPTPTRTPTPPPGATNTPTPTRTPTPPPGATNTPAPLAQSCGVKACDNTTNPCATGLICVQANDGSNYCTFSEFQNTCKSNPTVTSCCTLNGNTPTPTEIVLVQNTVTPGPSTTTVAAVTSIPPAGNTTFSKIFGLVSTAIILLGLIL